MATDERARHELLLRLQTVLGEKEAATLMEHLPPDRWPELVTKSDLSPLQADVAILKGDVAVLKSDVAELKTDVAELKTDVSHLRTDMEQGFAAVDQRFDHLGEKFDLRFDLQWARTEAFVRAQLNAQTRLLVFSIIGALMTTAAIALGAG